MANKIQFRRDTASNWTTANPTLSQGELGFETDTNKFKLGTGSTAWNSLSYTFNPSITANQDLNTTSNVTFNNVDVTSQVSLNRLGKLGAGLSNIEIAEDDNLTPQTDLRSDLGIASKRFGNAYLNTTTVGTRIVFPDASQQTTAWTGSVSTASVTGLSTVGYTNDYADLSNKPTSWSTSSITGLSVVGYTNNYNDLSNKPTIASYDQSLNTTNNVQFVNVVATGGLRATTGTQAGQTISAGGFPLDSNGQALIAVSNTQSVAMVVGNYNSGQLARIHIRGYGQNNPGGGATTAGNGQLLLEGSRGTGASPTATGSGDNIGAVNFAGYDGTNWLSSQAGSASTLPPASIFINSAEAFANNGTTTTNAGTVMFMRLQPIATQLNSTSRRNWFATSWTAGSTTTNTPPQLSIGIGQAADNSVPTLIPASGVGSFGTGSGRTVWAWNDCLQLIRGVPSQDTAPDNAGLTGTNAITFATGRRSSVSGRRDALASGDTIGVFNYQVQTAASQTGNGSLVGTISLNMLEAAGASARGTSFTVQTVNTGTTTLASRMILADRSSTYRSDTHNFFEKNGTFTAMSINTGTTYVNANTFGVNNAAGTSYLTLDTNGATFGTGSAIAIIAAKTAGNDLQLLSGGGSTNGGLVQVVSGGGVNISGGAGTSIANLTTSSAYFSVPIRQKLRTSTVARGATYTLPSDDLNVNSLEITAGTAAVTYIDVDNIATGSTDGGMYSILIYNNSGDNNISVQVRNNATGIGNVKLLDNGQRAMASIYVVDGYAACEIMDAA